MNVSTVLVSVQTPLPTCAAGVEGPIADVKNQAFIFVKPHAVTDASIALAKEMLGAAGVRYLHAQVRCCN